MCFQRSKKIEISQSFVAPREEQGHCLGQKDAVGGGRGVGGGGCVYRNLFLDLLNSTFYYLPIFVCFKNHGWRLCAGNDELARLLKNTRLVCTNLAGPQRAFLGMRLHLHCSPFLKDTLSLCFFNIQSNFNHLS